MIAGLKPYPQMKDSGVSWLGEVPEHWAVLRLKQMCAMRSGETITSETIDPVGDYPVYGGNGVRGYASSFTHEGEFPLVGRQGALCGNVHLARGKFWASEHAVVASPARGVRPSFLARALGCMDLGSYSIAAAQPGLAVERILALSAPLPTSPEQAAIVRFLHHADRQTRRYIRAKQKLIKLLEEQKQAIIHRVVTRGLDPNVRLKPSGLEWLEDVPQHWEVAALRRRWSVTDCKHLTVPFVDDDNGIPLASVREVQSFELSLAHAKRTTHEHYESLIEGDRKPREGDLIYCRNVSVGAAAIVTTTQPLAMGQDVCLIRSQAENQRYLNYFLRSPAMRVQLATLLVGSTFPRINVFDIKALTVVVPPRAEQDAIAKHLDMELVEFVRAQSLAEDEVSLLREFRTRLIADVVTGKLDVREAAARLPDETEDRELPNEVESEGDSDEESADDAELLEQAEV